MIELTNEIASTLVKGDGPDTVTMIDKAVVEMRNQVTAVVEAYVDQDGDACWFPNRIRMRKRGDNGSNETLDGGHSGFRYVNHKVLRNAPCSVGILVDRGFGLLGKMSTSYTSLNVAVIFIDGKDDKEALAYAVRVARHRREEETNLDDECFADFYERHVRGGHVSYLEKHLANSVETYSTLRSFERQYSLVIVGREGRINYVLTFGMSDWQQCPELGPISDVLSGSEFSATTSIMIIQQHNLRG
ncbi:hypothetical protein L484_012500 [Morus notabilis]|uniref:Cation/H(+) antiporter central domain-containing protein n=1 Tax=Morus notabilis TaxID=981085 RepID=W9QME7_9ROSA|nr:hypothetical protein L484_012500 [Morus notabilis]